MDSNVATACLVGVSVALVFYIIKLSSLDHKPKEHIPRPEDLVTDEQVEMFKTYLIEYFDNQ
jgi:hypothetical protein